MPNVSILLMAMKAEPHRILFKNSNILFHEAKCMTGRRNQINDEAGHACGTLQTGADADPLGMEVMQCLG